MHLYLMNSLTALLQKHQAQFSPVVIYNENDSIMSFDFTSKNLILSTIDLTDTNAFAQYLNDLRNANNATFGIGGYNENRVLYKRSTLFDSSTENRSIHLGIDIWGAAGTPVYAPLEGRVHSFAFNNNFGDYGATIILQHLLENYTFFTLYGHLSLQDINGLEKGQQITKGSELGHFGTAAENGNWPPHLHFQIINDMQGREGDYAGVCAPSEANFYLENCPDADLILGMMGKTL